MLERAGYPDISLELNGTVDWCEVKRIRLGSRSDRIRKVLVDVNKKVQADSKTVLTGYVLREGEDRFVIMIDDPRRIIEKPKEALRERAFCFPIPDYVRFRERFVEQYQKEAGPFDPSPCP